MRYLSVCSGIEAATVAWHPLGWQPVAFAEIDKFPCAVLAHHYPSVPNWGDLTKFREWPDATVDLLVGGTPCQSFSVAGLRAGLADPRGNLALTYLAVADRYRPRWLVWENVPGVLSSGGGRDFGALLGGLGELGYGWAYRVLDAQYFGLAQRRARVFVVGHLGDWRRAGAVLFERESLSGHPAPRREAGEGTTGVACRGVAPSLTSNYGKQPDSSDTGLGPMLIAHSLRVDGFDASEDGTGRGTPIVPIQNALRGEDQNGLGVGGDVMFTLDQASQHAIAVAFAELADPVAANQGRTYTREGTHNFRVSNVAIEAMQVRRLTPRECERLQGFPDDYTLIPYRGKLAADGPRYKALGNSMAVPVMAWIGRRIALVERILQEHAA